MATTILEAGAGPEDSPTYMAFEALLRARDGLSVHDCIVRKSATDSSAYPPVFPQVRGGTGQGKPTWTGG